jgi:RIO kinase 1
MFDYIRQDPRYETLSSKKREIVFAWTQREFRNLLKARECVRVPTPYKVKD